MTPTTSSKDSPMNCNVPPRHELATFGSTVPTLNWWADLENVTRWPILARMISVPVRPLSIFSASGDTLMRPSITVTAVASGLIRTSNSVPSAVTVRLLA